MSSQKWFSQYPALGPGSCRRGSDRGARTTRLKAHSAPLNAKATKETNSSFEITVKKQKTSSVIVDGGRQKRK